MIKPPGKPGIAIHFSSKTSKKDTYGNVQMRVAVDALHEALEEPLVEGLASRTFGGPQIAANPKKWGGDPWKNPPFGAEPPLKMPPFQGRPLVKATQPNLCHPKVPVTCKSLTFRPKRGFTAGWRHIGALMRLCSAVRN